MIFFDIIYVDIINNIMFTHNRISLYYDFNIIKIVYLHRFVYKMYICTTRFDHNVI